RLELDPLAVHGDGGMQIDARAELADDLAVDGDPSLDDVVLAFPARAEARMRQDLLEPLGLAGSLVVRGRHRPPGHRLPARWFRLRALPLAPRPGGPSVFPASRRRTRRLGATTRSRTPARRRSRPRHSPRPSRRLRLAMILPAGGLATSHGARSSRQARRRPDHRSRHGLSIKQATHSFLWTHSILEAQRTDGQGRSLVKARFRADSWGE